MADEPWKHFEREVACLLGGRRYGANSGERLDVEGPRLVAQCKHVRRMSLAELEALAVGTERLGETRGETGLVCVKRRARRRTPGCSS